MEITNLGNGLVKLSGRKFQIVAGPQMPVSTSGIDVIAVTQPVDTPTSVMVLDSPGEYEIGGVLVTGVAAKLHVDEEGMRGTNYIISGDDANVVVLANIAPGLANDQLEAMGQVDVLVIPVGGHGLTLDATAAAAIVAQVEPKVVIPVHYDDGVSSYAMPQDKIDAFLKEIGATPQEAAKFKIAKDLPEELSVVVLKPEAKAAVKP